MPFIINDDQKIHINLSSYALNIITDDLSTFDINTISNKKPNLNGFINLIINNYYFEAKSSISYRIMEYKDYLSEINIDNKTIDLLTKKLENEYKDSFSNFEKSNGMKFRLQNNLIEKILDSEDYKYYDNSLGMYLKAILEEYALLPYFKRELIIYKDTVDLINKSIEEKRKIRIELSGIPSRFFKVKPIRLIQDKLSGYNFLVSYSSEITHDSNLEYLSATFQLSKISKIKMTAEKSFISKEDYTLINKKIEDNGTFILTDNEIIKIRLTDNGIYNYKTKLYCRPHLKEIDKDDDHIYIFDSPAFQIETYFLSFGKDATILEPENLKNKFRNFYNEAIKAYNN